MSTYTVNSVKSEKGLLSTYTVNAVNVKSRTKGFKC